jgi:hypothetical protein
MSTQQNGVPDFSALARRAAEVTANAVMPDRDRMLSRSADQGETRAALPLWEGMVVKVTFHPDGRRVTLEVQYADDAAAEVLATLAKAGFELGETRDVARWPGAKEGLMGGNGKRVNAEGVSRLIAVG